ncbi:MAG: GNAT family N-acetyltransferase [Labedaea sp.]
MDRDQAAVTVRDEPARNRYLALLGDEVAGHLDYRPGEHERVFRHTVVQDGFQGKGVGSALTRAALDDLRAKGLRVRPLCPFVASWISRHPGYLELVADDYRDHLPAGR